MREDRVDSKAIRQALPRPSNAMWQDADCMVLRAPTNIGMSDEGKHQSSPLTFLSIRKQSLCNLKFW
jgi:hypothetical protein